MSDLSTIRMGQLLEQVQLTLPSLSAPAGNSAREMLLFWQTAGIEGLIHWDPTIFLCRCRILTLLHSCGSWLHTDFTFLNLSLAV